MVVDAAVVIEIEDVEGRTTAFRLSDAQVTRVLHALEQADEECDEKREAWKREHDKAMKMRKAAKVLKKMGADALPSAVIRAACRSLGIDTHAVYNDKRKDGRRIKVANLNRNQAEVVLECARRELKRHGVEVKKAGIESPKRDSFWGPTTHRVVFHVAA